MNRLTTILVIAIIFLVAAVAYLFGQGTNTPMSQSKSAEANDPMQSQSNSSHPANLPQRQKPKLPAQPVMVGSGGPNFDACGSNARVVGLNPRGDNFLAVKSAPRMDAPRLDKLGPGFEVYVCDESKDGEWLGVVYEPDGNPSANCGVTSPVATLRPYSGRCQAGWVHSKYVEIYAG